MTYMDRQRAAEYLQSLGIQTTASGLENRAWRGGGPRYSIVNGRALYTKADLDAWVAEQVARPVAVRRSRTAPIQETVA
jgi:hypothetical protein